jgi:hypothetical protein
MFDSLDVLLRERGDLERLARELGQGDVDEEGTGQRPTLSELQRATLWVWVYCEACPHYSPRACAVAVIRWGVEASSDKLRRCAQCTQAVIFVRLRVAVRTVLRAEL